MKKFLTFILMLLSTFTIGVNAKTVFVAASGNNTTGDSWTNALTSIPNSGSAAIVAGDSVFVKTGTYSLSQSTAGWACLATKADVNYLGGFAGSEGNSAQRALSDLDVNGIIEPWEFSNATTLNLTATNNAYGLYITTNTTTQRVFDGFKITGSFDAGTLNASAGNTMVRIFGYTNFRNNIIESCTLTATGTLGASYTKGTLIFVGNGSASTVFNQVDNCLIQNNTSTVTAGSTQTDAQQSPLFHMEASSGSGRNLFSNCVIRKNRVTVDFSATTLTTNYNTRGVLFSMSIQGSGAHTAWNAFKNNLVYNNDATYTSPSSGAHSLGNGGLIFPYNTNYASIDSVLNNTIANNKMTKIGTAIKIGINTTITTSLQNKTPYHKVLNNTLYNNTNYNGSTTSAANIAVTSNPDNTTAGILIANNYSTAGGLTNTTGANPNIVNNVVDLSTTNADATKGAWFTAPTANTLIGYNTDASVATSRWTIGSSSYLKAKASGRTHTYDKAGFAFSSTPSVGAYEQYTPTISGATTTLAFTSIYGTASTTQQFSVSGTKLYGNLVATAPIGYEVSTNGSSYGATATISRGTGNPSGTIYMRLKSINNAGNYNSLNTVLSSTDASSVNISTPASGNTVSPKALSISAAFIASKVYDGSTTSGTVTPGTLSDFVGSETVNVNTAIGTYADANVGTGKTATIVYTLANGTGGGLAANYSLANSSATGDITAATGVPTGDNLNNSGLTNEQLANTNLTISSGEFIINDTKTVRSLTLAPGAKLTHSSGTLTATNGITLESDANGTATLMDNYSEPTITATVKQYVTAGRNWYMSAPLNNTADYAVLNKGNSVAEYNEVTGLWPTVTTGTLTRGKGYVQVASATQGTTGTVSFAGTTNSGNVAVTLTNTLAGGKGFNLVGNPYPSYLSWSAVAADNAAANMPTGTMWYRTISYNGKSAWAPSTAYSLNEIVYNGTRFYKVTTAGTSAYSGGPTGGLTGIADGSVVWNYEGSIYLFATISASGVASPATVSNLVPPMQAFWVKSTGGTLTFKNAMRSHNTGGANVLKAPRSSASDLKLLRLNVSNGASADEAVIYASAEASNAFDSYDAPKYFNLAGSNQPEIYTQVGAEKLVINAMNEINQGTEIPLGFATEKGNNFTISASELKNLGSDMKVILKDKQYTSEFDLTSGQSYQFSSSVVNSTDRFSLIFRTSGTSTGINNTEKGMTQVFVNAANQITIIAPIKSNYAIYNAVGQLIENGVINTERETRNTKQKAAGVYVVKVNNQSTRVVAH